MKTKRICACMILVSMPFLLSACMTEIGLGASSRESADTEPASILDITVQRTVSNLGVGGITDIVVETLPGETQPSVIVVGMGGFAILDDDYQVRERRAYRGTVHREWVPRQVVWPDKNEAPIIVTAGNKLFDVLEAHDLTGKRLWTRGLQFTARYVKTIRGKDGRVYICAIGPLGGQRRKDSMAIMSLAGKQLHTSSVPQVNGSLTISVWNGGDGDRVWYGSWNRVVSIDEHGKVTVRSLGGRNAWINEVTPYRLLGETNERAILVAYTKVVDPLGMFRKQKYDLLIGDSVDDLRRENIADEDTVLGRRAGPKLDDAGAYRIQFYPISSQAPGVGLSSRSAYMWINADDGSSAAEHTFVPVQSSGPIQGDGAMAIIARNTNHTVALVGMGQTFWVVNIAFPVEGTGERSALGDTDGLSTSAVDVHSTN